MFLLMWIALVKGTRFTYDIPFGVQKDLPWCTILHRKGFDVVKGVHKSGWRDARNSVFFACIPSLIMR